MVRKLPASVARRQRESPLLFEWIPVFEHFFNTSKSRIDFNTIWTAAYRDKVLLWIKEMTLRMSILYYVQHEIYHYRFEFLLINHNSYHDNGNNMTETIFQMYISFPMIRICVVSFISLHIIRICLLIIILIMINTHSKWVLMVPIFPLSISYQDISFCSLQNFMNKISSLFLLYIYLL